MTNFKGLFLVRKADCGKHFYTPEPEVELGQEEGTAVSYFV